MKKTLKQTYVALLVVFAFLVLQPIFGKSSNPPKVSTCQLKGYIGSRIDQCINNQIKKQHVSELTQIFESRTEKKLWQTEFWGKWMLSASAAYKYHQDAELFEMMKNSVGEILATQTQDGYIGNYASEYRLQGWDIWGQKYTLLGLLSFYDITKQKNILIASTRLADYLIDKIHATKINISRTGKYRGMPSSSVLEPIVKLYSITNNPKYLDFAKEIVASWEMEDGAGLISKSLSGISVGDRFKTPKIWWSWENGEKAYEMLSCYDGLLDLFRITNDSTYLKAVQNTVEDVIRTEINIVGSGSAMECFYHGTTQQTEPTYHTMETCFTFSWMKLCLNLLHYTTNSVLADQVEKTAYNAMLAALNRDGTEFAKYTGLEGHRETGERQCGLDINCCNANGPRGLLLITDWSVMVSNNQIYVNGYESAKYRVNVSSNEFVDIEVVSTYPESGTVKIKFMSTSASKFDLLLRIPSWTDQAILKSGKNRTDTVSIPGYYKISTMGKQNDSVLLDLKMQAKIIRQAGYQAIVKGPIVFARDSRFNDGFVDESVVFQSKNFILKPVEQHSASNFWMIVSTNGIFGTNLESDKKNGCEIKLCDFASAGNDWNSFTRYRVWLKETVNVMNNNYVAY